VSARRPAAKQSTGAGWRSEAACTDHHPDLFFPSEDAPAELVRVQEATAKAICRSCPVAGICLSTALGQGLAYGVWGGLSADDRRAVLAARSRPRTGAEPSPSTGGRTHRAKRARSRRRSTRLCTAPAGTVAVPRPEGGGPVEVSA
jgi:WhiB family redox-sensing transcriptional regulator